MAELAKKSELTPLAESNLLVVGVVRNCGKQVCKDVMLLKNALEACRSLKWLLIESDSDDNTLEVLKKLSKRIDDFEFKSFGTLRIDHPLRTARLAICRNEYLNQLRSDLRYKDIDFVVIADFDGINTKISRSAIESCWTKQDWDVCTANQNGPYYDIWALRHDIWCPNDCWDQYKVFQNLRNNKSRNKFAAVYSKMITIPPNAPWMKVFSSFGGLAIYRRAALDDGWYVGVTEGHQEVCEHVALHQHLGRKGYKIFINPQMLNTDVTEHSVCATRFGVRRHKIRKFLPRLSRIFISLQAKIVL